MMMRRGGSHHLRFQSDDVEGAKIALKLINVWDIRLTSVKTWLKPARGAYKQHLILNCINVWDIRLTALLTWLEHERGRFNAVFPSF